MYKSLQEWLGGGVTYATVAGTLEPLPQRLRPPALLLKVALLREAITAGPPAPAVRIELAPLLPRAEATYQVWGPSYKPSYAERREAWAVRFSNAEIRDMLDKLADAGGSVDAAHDGQPLDRLLAGLDAQEQLLGWLLLEYGKAMVRLWKATGMCLVGLLVPVL